MSADVSYRVEREEPRIEHDLRHIEEGCDLAFDLARAGSVERQHSAEAHHVVAERVTSFAAPCSGTVEWSSDFCSASFEATCPAEEFGPGYRNRQVSHTSFTMDGLIRTGTFELTVFDAKGDIFCESTYDTLTENESCRP